MFKFAQLANLTIPPPTSAQNVINHALHVQMEQALIAVPVFLPYFTKLPYLHAFLPVLKVSMVLQILALNALNVIKHVNLV